MIKKGNREKIRINRQSGFTLIELILVVALLGVVIGAVISFQKYGTTVFGKGAEQSDIQSSLRGFSDFIIKEVRNSGEITLSAPSDPDNYYKIYLDGKKLKYKAPGETAIDKTGPIIANSSTDFSFSLENPGSGYVLKYNIKGTLDASAYTMASGVLLNNIKTATVGTGTTIYYKKGATAPLPPASTAHLNTLVVSGYTLSPSFDPSTYDYTVILPYGTTDVPEVTATGKDGATFTITEASSLPGTTSINVTSFDGTRSETYEVDFVVTTAEEVIEAALDGITSLTVNYPGNNNASANKPTIKLPTAVNGIVYSFSASSTSNASASINTSTGVVTRASADCIGTITLKGTLGGQMAVKVFDVNIPRNKNNNSGNVTANAY